MKTITFEGKQYEVEDWVSWVARDENGSVWAHEQFPKSYEHIWYSGGKIDRLAAPLPWETTLTKV